MGLLNNQNVLHATKGKSTEPVRDRSGVQNMNNLPSGRESTSQPRSFYQNFISRFTRSNRKNSKSADDKS